MPESSESFWAKAIASSLMSTPVISAPRAASDSVSWPELHWRWTMRFPARSPRSSSSSGKSVLPPSRRKRAWSPLWLLWACVARFHDCRFCSWMSFRSVIGGQRRANHSRRAPAEASRQCGGQAAQSFDEPAEAQRRHGRRRLGRGEARDRFVGISCGDPVHAASPPMAPRSSARGRRVRTPLRNVVTATSASG